VSLKSPSKILALEFNAHADAANAKQIKRQVLCNIVLKGLHRAKRGWVAVQCVGSSEESHRFGIALARQPLEFLLVLAQNVHSLEPFRPSQGILSQLSHELRLGEPFSQHLPKR
jgi:hypothetical protein